MDQEGQATDANAGVANAAQVPNVLDKLQLSEEAKKQLQGNTELLDALTHNIQAKRSANAEAKAQREELEQLKKEKEGAEKEKLKEQGEFKKLYEQSQATIAEKEAKLQQVTISNQVALLATQKGIKKTSYLKMFDTSGLTVKDDLSVDNLESSFANFYKENPDLFASMSVPSTDSGKPNITTSTVNASELEELTKAAKRGNTRDIARLRMFKRKHGLLKT